MSKINVLIVEDEPLIAEDIREYLTNQDYEVCGIAYDFEEAKEVLSKEQPEIALLDVNLRGQMDGFKVAELINEKYSIPFIYLTSYSNKSVIEQAKHTRPMGYIVKPFNEKDLYTSIEIALYNHAQRSKPAQLSLELINQKLLTKFTNKEYEILMDIYDGRTNRQMCEHHFVSINTIKTHVQKIYEKLDVHTRAQAITRVRELLAS